MKESMISLLLGFIVHFAAAQEIGFIPPKSNSVSQEDYNKGKYILENTYKSMEEHGDIVYADYWNIAVGYSYTGYDKNKVWEFLKKSKATDKESFCAIIHHGKKEIKSGKFFKLFGDDFLALIADCKNVGVPKPMQSSLKEKSHYNGLNYELISQLDAMMVKDQKYRRDDDVLTNKEKWAKQKALDGENQRKLKIIFDKYGYPGKSLVGDEYNDFACLILEHGSDLDFQEKYFPLVIEAMKKGEVEKNMVRMLIDRIHWKKTGKQIFGSHIGVPMEAENIIREVQHRYGL